MIDCFFIQVFGRAVHSLSKIGEELYVEPLEHGLALRTVNSSRSAYACFVFAPNFFQHYDDGIEAINSQASDEEPLRCKIGMKTCLTVFKSLSTIEKTVERCQLSLDMKSTRLVFQMYCKHGITKTHNLAFIECETLQAVFSKDLCPNVLTAQTRLLCDAVLNFQVNLEEITILLNPEKICLKNYLEDEPDPNKLVRTELNLSPDEFERYQVGVDCEVTFCLKELRAILAFSESANNPISIHFEGAGKPIVFSIDSDPTFEGNFVLATLAPEGTSNSQRSFQQTRPTSKHHSDASRNFSINSTDNNPQTSLDDGEAGDKGPPIHKPERKRKSVSARFDAAYEELMNDDLDEDMNEGVSRMEDLGEQSAPVLRGDLGTPITSSPIIPMQISKVAVKSNIQSMEMNEQEKTETSEEGDLVPGTPPRKKFKSLFFGLSQSSVPSQRHKDQSLVLADDTDDEDD